MENRIDALSPSFLGGLVGYAITDTGAGFFMGFGLVYFGIFALLLLAAALDRPSVVRLEPAE